MPDLCQSPGGTKADKSPWIPANCAASALAISMTASRAALPRSARRILWVAVAVSAVMSLRFAMLGAWPVLIFSALDIGGLYVALHMFSRSRSPEERLRFQSGRIAYDRIDAKGRTSKITLPAYWTQLEIQERPDGDCRLWLVFRQKRYPIGMCLGPAERRAIAPQIQHALQSQQN